jgi:protein-S-isoprenylcysteine O-methyltransferase Ste14
MGRQVSVWRQLRAVGLCPGLVTLVVPALIVWRTEVEIGWGLPEGPALLPIALGAALLAVGLLLVVRTVALLAVEGGGTLAPWDPTSRLVVRGPYRYVRNPMISGVLFLLLGEAALLGSVPLLAWFLIVLAVNAVYLPLVEEPDLRSRFGEDYDRYRANVPRWVPRLRPWQP